MGPWHTGSLVVYAGRALGIPVLVSLHSDRDSQRRVEPSLLLHMVRPWKVIFCAMLLYSLCVSDYLHGYADNHGARQTYIVYSEVYCE